MLSLPLTATDARRARSIAIAGWVARALIQAGRTTSAAPFVALVHNALLGADTDPAAGEAAVAAYGVIVANTEQCLTRDQHAELRLMYRQRFFLEQLPQLVSGFNAGGGATRSACLLALSHLMASVPRQVRNKSFCFKTTAFPSALFIPKVLLSELPVCLPLVLEALNATDVSLLVSTLKTTAALLIDASDEMALHVNTLIPRLLDLTRAPAMAVRRQALQTLEVAASLPTQKVCAVNYGQTKRLISLPLRSSPTLLKSSGRLSWCWTIPSDWFAAMPCSVAVHG